ncbi:MAG: TVP38/TMEM64 family protein, partial [Oscillospiraceae bacterium]|nr:TVP38/TMEM64 family protein [Oscillospiraceae bacterium]
FIIMLIPGTPKDLLSYFAPLTKMKLSTWMLIVSITRIPSIITSSIGGSALNEQKYMFAGVAFAITILISGIGVLIYKKIEANKTN